MTLLTMKALQAKFNLYLVDCKKNSIFKEKANNLICESIDINCVGKIKNSFSSVGIKEIAFFPFGIINNIYIIAKKIKKYNLNKHNTINYVTTKKTLILAFFLKQIFGIQYIYHSHIVNNKKSIFYLLISSPLKNSKKIICVSHYIEKNINLPNTITLYNPANSASDEVKSIANKEKIIIASFSTLTKMKGIEYFMKSFDFLKNQANVEYWIFGDGSEKDYLEKFQNKNVILRGFSLNPEVLMKNYIDIIVIPSIAPESFGMVFLEAFANAIPVITTNIGGQNEVVIEEKVGYKVNIKNPKQIAKKIDYLIDNRDIYEQMSKNALEYSKKFSLERYNEQILDIFKQSLK